MAHRLSETLSSYGWLSKKSLYWLAWLMVAIIVVSICILSLSRKFDHDEFEAIKTAWKLYQGQRIYVDFFQHHNPFLYYLLTPLFTFFGETKYTILAARILILFFLVGILFLTHEIARKLFNKQATVISVVFLVAVPMFVNKGIEVRPDVPQTFFGLLSVYCLIVYFQAQRTRDLILSALALCVAFLFLQKAVFLIVLTYGILGWRCIQGQFAIRQLLLYTVVLVSGWGLYATYLTVTGQFSEYFFFNFGFYAEKLDYFFASDAGKTDSPVGLNGAQIDTHFRFKPPGKTNRYAYPFKRLLSNFNKANSFVLFCLLVGVFCNKRREQYEIALLALGLLALAMLYPVQYQQYYLMSLPLIAVVAANGWVQLYRKYPLLGFLVLTAAFVSPAQGYIKSMRYRVNTRQLAKIEYVTRITTSNDYVYDGNIKFNLFRKDLDFFWYGFRPGRGISTYRKLRGRYDYDIYALIEKYEPKVISRHAIRNMNDSRIRNHYRRSRRYRKLYLRTQ